jgi:Na+/H+ antiporter
MEHYAIVLFILALMIVLSSLADKIKLPYPILLITAGIAIGFIPSMPEVQLDPEIVFLIFLPPLLYDAAFNISFQEFRTNINTISTLAIPLVFMTASAIAVVAHYLIGMSWSVSFVLGAILSATDAVAAMSITKGLGLSHKTNTILEGESLVNDASALVAYRFAVAAVTGASFVIWKASLTFLIVLGGGFLVGFLVGKILGRILFSVKDNAIVTISFMLLMPFVTYLIAEELHVSGVIAVVVLGLSIAHLSRKVFPENLKAESRTIWDIVIFMLNGLIFILIGLELPYVLRSIENTDIGLYSLYALVITLVALGVRMARVFLQKINLQKGFEKDSRKIKEDELLDFGTSLVISWSGMRGIVSLAIAIGLPETLGDGSPFPERNAIIFISVMVVLFTLVGQGLTLPWIIKRFGHHPVPRPSASV